MIIDGLSVSCEMVEALKKYEALLLKWNKTINLISKNSEKDIWYRHIIDSLQLIRYINCSDVTIDIGSGAGLPGIVLSIGGINNVTLIECNQKKVEFLIQTSKLSNNKVNIITNRLNSGFTAACDILTCRGFSDLSNIFHLTSNIEIKKKILLLKGESYNEELKKAQEEWLFNIKVYDSLTSDKGKILEISDVQKII